MKNYLTAVVFLLTLSTNALAWGPTGHRVTGWIAERHLSRKARTALDKMLNGQSLAIASTWMDEVRSDSTYDHMIDWHWVTIPQGENYVSADKNPKGDIIGTLERIIRELKTKGLDKSAQLERVKILIHLIGDIHQPLHVSALDDGGGNNEQVTWFGGHSNLHRVWDSDIIDHTRLSYTEMAQSLGKPSPADIRAWQAASVQEWARESQAHHAQVYDYDTGRLGYRYVYLNYPIIRHRLLQAGVRLAGILNEIYG
jgi:hypothetical protein